MNHDKEMGMRPRTGIELPALLLVLACGILSYGCAVGSVKLSHAGLAAGSNLSLRLYEMYLVEVSPRAVVAALTITNSSETELLLSASDILLSDTAGNSVAAVGEPPPPPSGARKDPSWLPAARIAAAPLQVALFLMTLPVSLPMTIAGASQDDRVSPSNWETKILFPKSEIPVWVSFRERNIRFEALASLRVKHPATGEVIELRLQP